VLFPEWRRHVSKVVPVLAFFLLDDVDLVIEQQRFTTNGVET